MHRRKRKSNFWQQTITSDQKLRSNLAHLYRVNSANLSSIDKEKTFVINTIQRQQDAYIKDLKMLLHGELTVPVSELHNNDDDDDEVVKFRALSRRRMSLPVIPSDVKKRLEDIQESSRQSQLRDKEADHDTVGVEDEISSIASTVGSAGDLEDFSTSASSDGGQDWTCDNPEEPVDVSSKVTFLRDVSNDSHDLPDENKETETRIDKMEAAILDNIRRMHVTNTNPLEVNGIAADYHKRRLSLPDVMALKRMQACRPGRTLLQSSTESFESKPEEEHGEDVVKVPKQRPNTPRVALHHEHHAKCFQDLPPGERPLCLASKAELRRRQMKFRAKTHPPRSVLLDIYTVGQALTRNQRPVRTSFGGRNSATPTYQMPALIPDETTDREVLTTLRKVSMTPTLSKEDEQKTLFYLSKINQNRQNHLISSKIENFLKKHPKNSSYHGYMVNNDVDE